MKRSTSSSSFPGASRRIRSPGRLPAKPSRTTSRPCTSGSKSSSSAKRPWPARSPNSTSNNTFKGDRRAVALGLPEGVALVEFARFDVSDLHAVPARGERRWQPARYLAFVLPASQPNQVQMIDLGQADPIDRMIADFRDSVAVDPRDHPGRDVRRHRPESPPAAQGEAGPALRAAVFDKLLPALGNCNRLLLAPDGDLTRLPFEVLPDADGRLLLDRLCLPARTEDRGWPWLLRGSCRRSRRSPDCHAHPLSQGGLALRPHLHPNRLQPPALTEVLR